MNALNKKFDVVREIAESQLNVPADTIRKWKEDGRQIPAKYHLQLIARSDGALTPQDFMTNDFAISQKTKDALKLIDADIAVDI